MGSRSVTLFPPPPPPPTPHPPLLWHFSRRPTIVVVGGPWALWRQVHVIEVRDLKGENASGTSDPVVIAEVCTVPVPVNPWLHPIPGEPVVPPSPHDFGNPLVSVL